MISHVSTCVLFFSGLCQLMDKIHLLDYNVKFVKCQFLTFMILSFIHLLNDCEKQSIVINVFSKALKKQKNYVV